MAPMLVPPRGRTTGEADDGNATSASPARFEEVFRTLHPKLAAHLRARFPTLSWPDAEDAVAEAFLYAYREWERVAELDNLTGYLVRAAHHKAIDIVRSQRRVAPTEESNLAALLDQVAHHQVSAATPDSEVWDLVREAADDTNREKLRQLVSLQAAGASDTAIATALGITTNHVHVQRSRAIKELRESLTAYIRDGHARRLRKVEPTPEPAATPPGVPERLSIAAPTAAEGATAPKRRGRPGASPKEATALMREAGFEPLEPYPGANTKWRCRCISCGNEVFPRYGTAKKGHGCRFCAGQVVRPQAAAALMRERGLEPIGAYPGATKKWAYTCTVCGHEGVTTYHSVKSQGSGCIRCGRHRAAAAQRLSPSAASAVMQKAGYEPLEDYPGSGAPWRCQCTTCGTEAMPTYDNVMAGNRCGICAHGRRAESQRGKAPWAAINSQRINPESAVQVMVAARFRPLEPFTSSATPWRCECLVCGLESSPSYHSVNSKNTRCRYCQRRSIDPQRALKVMREHGLEPQSIYQGSIVPWTCRCTNCGEIVAVSYHAVTASDAGCRWCGIQRRAATRRIDADVAASEMRDAGFEPLAPYPGSKVPWPCRCTVCGKEGTPTMGGVRQNYGCAHCSGRIVDREEAEDLMREQGYEPLEPYPGASTHWKCRCTYCGNIVHPTYSNARSGYGCRKCCPRGISYDQPAVVYLITHCEFRAVKIGITGQSAKVDRIQRHIKQDWKVFRRLEVTSGEMAFRIEQAVLRHLRDELGLPAHVAQQDMPQGGYTETFDAEEATPYELWQLIKQAAISPPELS
ncbi:RNA polymerase sigma factor [Streptomyces sp. NPDC050658]|uniref:RNA polymerase sigma factor n=1 Tax=unclassified Streptomyces TaxID=2593676 RepID=UPI003440964D